MDKIQDYAPSITDRWPDSYYVDRSLNDPKRLLQFKQDARLINQYINNGNLCDIGCSTGEFLRHLEFDGNFYGIEINHSAKEITSEFISFDKNIFTESDFFDAVIFRGTIQHVDIPFQMIKSAFDSLKPGGYIFFLATPNSCSILYRLKQNLPFLDWSRNFYIPGKKTLLNALENFGFQVIDVQLPYWNTPYRNLIKDHFYFIMNILSSKFYNHAFWGSSMNIVAVKPI